MPTGFFRSKKGEEAYASVQKEYENTLSDNNFIDFEKATANSPHSARNKKVIRVLLREIGDDGNQYLVYDLNDRRYTAIGREEEFYCPGIGRYPIPITRPEVVMGENMSSQILSGPIIRYDIGYDIPFTKENCDKLHEMCNDLSQRERTQYILKRAGGRKITISSYEDFRDGDFQDLEEHGKVTLKKSSPSK